MKYHACVHKQNNITGQPLIDAIVDAYIPKWVPVLRIDDERFSVVKAQIVETTKRTGTAKPGEQKEGYRLTRTSISDQAGSAYPAHGPPRISARPDIALAGRY